MLRDLRDLHKRLGKCRGTCAACANVLANAAGLAQPAQTPRQIPWDLRDLRKRLGKCRGTQRDLRERLGKCRGTQRDLRKCLGKCRGTCGSTLAPSEKPNERTPLDVPLIGLWFYS